MKNKPEGMILSKVTVRPLRIPKVVDIQKVFSLAADKGDNSSYNVLPLGQSAGTPGSRRNRTEANSGMTELPLWGENVVDESS